MVKLNTLKKDDIDKLKKDEVFLQSVLKDNDALIKSIIKWPKIKHKWPMYIEEEDLKQEMYIAFLSAVHNYESEKGKFSSYAFQSMKNSMIEMDQKNQRHSAVRIPTARIGYDDQFINGLRSSVSHENEIDDRVSLEQSEKQLNEINSKILAYKKAGLTKIQMAKKLGLGLRIFEFIWKHSFIPSMKRAL